jgi:uncharacterized protein (TIGR02588 family)
MSPRPARGWNRERSPFEWALLVGSALATLAVVVGLAVSGLSQPDGPADLRLSVSPATTADDGRRSYDVTIENDGGASAVNVVVEVTAGDVVREVTVDLVADGETATATVVFPADAPDGPHAEVVGFEAP